METIAEPITKTKPALTEDWTVVVLGLLIIGLSLSGIVIPVPAFGWKEGSDLTATVLSVKNGLIILEQFGFTYAIALIGAILTGKPLRSTLFGFPIIFGLTLLALVLAGNKTLKDLNLEAVIFSLSIGLLVGNLVQLPDWLKGALATELFVKIGLVLLGTTVIFGDILKAGSLGLVQALVVVVSVWYFAYWISKRLKIDDELTMMLASAVSICGVSAAIATSGAIQGDSKKLSYVISLVLITAIPMMLFMPYAAHALGLSPEVTGAWLGGTIDTTGAVVASGTLAGDEALKISTIVKFSQNVLLGVAAFAISVYWTYTKNQSADVQASKPTLGVIWERFPKFILGFLGASLLFSFVLDAETVDSVKGSLKSLQGLWFALAFTSIGLETRFADLFKAENRRPLYAFLIAQTFNIFITLLIAYFLFR
ncbi:putative sulfate exporter family transporter [Spirosoma aureum]|uniref:Putative sulfate exporter family transporter n=1 Tax=Spirosoma aureum TaxID=2692134 RepID=A0A6G9AXS9_9BACT|nr:putative sulfate exporter family transporter [Spirosoma aureum]QIP17003.1 putative sulfate exporter family transporter [Spirosoma aureum]